MAREELKWQNIDADDLPAEVKKSFDAMVRCSSDLYSAPLCGEWRPHELRPEHTGNVPSARNICGSHPQGRKAGLNFCFCTKAVDHLLPPTQDARGRTPMAEKCDLDHRRWLNLIVIKGGQPIEQVNSSTGGCNVPHVYDWRGFGSHAFSRRV